MYSSRLKRILLTKATLLLIPLLLSNIFSIPKLKLGAIGTVFWLLIIMPTLGIFVVRIFLKKRPFISTEKFAFAVSFGLLIFYVISLVLNFIALIIKIHIFQIQFVLPVVDIIFLFLLLCSPFTNADVVTSIQTHLKNKPKHYILALIPITFPLLAVVGAINLNNYGSGIFAMIALALIIIFQVVIIALCQSKRKLPTAVYVSTIMFSSLALILSISMRSKYLLGFDINQEFQVFRATQIHGYWAPSLFSGNSYNTCLSITILPSLLHAIIPVSDLTIFKYTMQFFLSFVPLIVFAVAQKLFRKRSYAYLAALFYIVQFQFITQFPALLRQQPATIFFGMIFLTLINEKISVAAKRLLVILFGFATILSHYSTAYVAVVLLTVITIFTYLANHISNKKPGRSKYLTTPGISVVVVLMLGIFLWNIQITSATGGVFTALSKSFSSIGSIFKSDTRSSYLNDTLGIQPKAYTTQTIDSLANETSVPGGYFNPSGYTPIPLSPTEPAPSDRVQSVIYSLSYSWVPTFLKLVFALGLLSLVWLCIKRLLPSGYLVWITSSCFVFALIIILPSISVYYNFERLYQQLLILLAGAIIGFSLLISKIRFISEKTSFFITGGIVIVYLLATSGFINQLVFKTSSVNVSNIGASYQQFYVHSGEVDAILWASNNLKGQSIDFDRYAATRSDAYSSGDYTRNIGVLPQQVGKNDYVFANYVNIKLDIAFEEDNSQVITFNFPTAFYADNKNVVYNNSESTIY
jgi:uncharacterized membrane protein